MIGYSKTQLLCYIISENSHFLPHPIHYQAIVQWMACAFMLTLFIPSMTTKELHLFTPTCLGKYAHTKAGCWTEKQVKNFRIHNVQRSFPVVFFVCLPCASKTKLVNGSYASRNQSGLMATHNKQCFTSCCKVI